MHALSILAQRLMFGGVVMLLLSATRWCYWPVGQDEQWHWMTLGIVGLTAFLLGVIVIAAAGIDALFPH